MPKAFEQLYKDFPAIKYFEKHENIAKQDNKRPHNCYYLAYEKSIYHKDAIQGDGIIMHHQLADSWQQFIAELSR